MVYRLAVEPLVAEVTNHRKGYRCEAQEPVEHQNSLVSMSSTVVNATTLGTSPLHQLVAAYSNISRLERRHIRW